MIELRNGTPEFAANQFFEYIKNKNFGKPVELYAKNLFKEVSVKVKAGKFRKEYSEIDIQDFSVSSVIDIGSAVSEVEMIIQYLVHGESKQTNMKLRMIYEVGAEIENRLMVGGAWKIVNVEALVDFFEK